MGWLRIVLVSMWAKCPLDNCEVCQWGSFSFSGSLLTTDTDVKACFVGLLNFQPLESGYQRLLLRITNVVEKFVSKRVI